jgi:hypothetical protein
MYRRMGWDRETFAKEFQVAERTVRNWEAGRTRIPYTAFKLLRLRLRDELPGWDEWQFVAGELVSPEGHRYGPKDFSWLSLTVRQARTCSVLYNERKGMRLAIEEAHQQIAMLKTALLTSEGTVRLADLLAEGDPLFGLLDDLRRGWTPLPGRDCVVTRPEIPKNGTFQSESEGFPGGER